MFTLLITDVSSWVLTISAWFETDTCHMLKYVQFMSQKRKRFALRVFCCMHIVSFDSILFLHFLIPPVSLHRNCGDHMVTVNTLRPKQNGRHFTDDIFKCIFLNENNWISLKISLKFVPKGPINNIPALVQIMAWRRPGDKLLSEPIMVSLPTHICVTRPQWVKWCIYFPTCIVYCIPPFEVYLRP